MTANRQTNPEQEYTAAELAGDWWWVDDRMDAVPVGGRVGYETLTWGDGRKVRAWRLEASNGLRSIYRYVDPEMRFRLVPVGIPISEQN